MLASSSGLAIAARAALMARLSPDEYPMPISAVPASFMILRTSAKSVLMRPGVVIRSAMPWTPCRSTSSQILNALTIDVCSSEICSNRSFGITISVSTLSFSHSIPCCAWIRDVALEGERASHDPDGERADAAGNVGDDRRPTGASASTFAGGDEDHVCALEHLFDLSAVLFCRGASDLGSGSCAEPAGALRPMSKFTSASLVNSACTSVFTAMNSTPLRPASTMRFTALQPPPPIPMTLIAAK